MHLNRALLVCVLLSFFYVACKESRAFQKDWLDKMLGCFAQSGLVDCYNQYLARIEQKCLDRESQKNNVQDACEKLKELGRKAQIAVGVPQERIVPIKQTALERMYACVVPGFIIVNSDNELTDDASRCLLHHEAVHTKYHDAAIRLLITSFIIFTSSVSSFGVTIAEHRRDSDDWLPLAYACAVFFSGLAASYFVDTTYTKYFQRRADIEGYYATECFRCVSGLLECRREELLQHARSILNSKASPTSCPKQELTAKLFAMLDPAVVHLTGEQREAKAIAMLDPMVVHLTGEQREAKAIVILDSMRSRSGYLSLKETQQIADDLKQENKLCEIHEES